jgi:hypothetical protein
MLVLSCSTRQREINPSTLIDVSDALEKKQVTHLSMFIDSVVYVPLELSNRSLITTSPRIELTKDFIIVRNWGRKPPLLLVFDRETGKFLRDIGTMGRGPNEYSSIPKDFFNQMQETIYAIGNNNSVLIYDLFGDVKDVFKIPDHFQVEGIAGLEGIQFSSGSFDTYLDTNTFASYVNNYSGYEKKKMVLFSKDKIVKIFPNYLSWERAPSNNINVLSLESIFYHFNNRLFFKEAFNDTLFEVRKDTLTPRYVFSFGQYGIHYALQDEYLKSGKRHHAFTLDHFTENHNYLFFTIQTNSKTYLTCYDKRNNYLKVCEEIDSYTSALIDDINNFLPVTGFHFNERNEFITYFDALSVREWIESNPDRANTLSEKYPWLKDFDESGNPIIMIGRCKN